MVVEIMVLGVGATLLMDLWALLRRRWFGVASMDYGWVGRWLGHMRHGQFCHTAIAKAPPLRGERALGWGFHYLTGLLFAAAFLAWGGQAWLQRPALVPALAFGVVTMAAPLLLMQPAFGMGIAARRAPKPWLARQRALLTHLVFGLGLYLSGTALVWLG